MDKTILVDFGEITADGGMLHIEQTSNGAFSVGKDGVKAIFTTADRKLELIGFEDKTIAYVPSALGYDAYYPIKPVNLEKPVEAVLMDLDGTSVKSEEFWMWIIEQTMAEVICNPSFKLVPEDFPYVAGHSVAEHLSYCIDKYIPGFSLDEARRCYNNKVEYEMREIMQGRGKKGVFTPAKGLKEFLLELKSRNIKIGLVTSGLYEKAMPEIISAFRTLDMGDPTEFYDAIITAGTRFQKGSTGTLSELPIKPHPWLYAETGRFGLGVLSENRNSVVVIEDSGAGVCSARLAGYTTIGIGGGNIISSGTKDFCTYYEPDLESILKKII